MVRLAAVAELCLLGLGLHALVAEVLVQRLGSDAIDIALSWLRWLMA